MHPLTPRQVCNAEYRAARAVRPPSSKKSAAPPAGSAVVKARGGTQNRLVWLQIGLFLEDRVVNP